MEGEARVLDRRWRVRRRLRSEMEGEARVFDRRWRVREKMEGDRALQRVIGFKMCLSKIKEKKMTGLPKKKLKTNVLWLRVLNAAVAPSKKNVDVAIKNAALDIS